MVQDILMSGGQKKITAHIAIILVTVVDILFIYEISIVLKIWLSSWIASTNASSLCKSILRTVKGKISTR